MNRALLELRQTALYNVMWRFPEMPYPVAPKFTDKTANGKAVKIEIKIGRDRQSEAQKRYQEQIERAGGLYVIATSFEQFYGWYQETF